MRRRSGLQMVQHYSTAHDEMVAKDESRETTTENYLARKNGQTKEGNTIFLW
jgi:hypothetical protein